MSTLSITDCAAQLDLYAASHEKAAADQIAHSETLPEGNGRALSAMLAVPAKASAHSLRFAATFLRENAVPRWTTEMPTKEGVYWVRCPGERRFAVQVYRSSIDQQLWMADVDQRAEPAQTEAWPLMGGSAGTLWCGPLPEPEEPTP